MTKKISLNFDEELLKYIDEYAQKNKINRTDAIHDLIQKKETQKTTQKTTQKITMNFNEELLERIDKYAKKNGINRTAAIHFLINTALKEKE